MDRGYVIGIDSGGSHTRVVCADLDGRVRGTGRGLGGSPTHNVDAKRHVRDAVRAAMDAAAAKPAAIVAMVSGMAGFDQESDQAWAAEFLDLDGLGCRAQAVNDAVVAQAGAFAGDPGIVAIAGTGSMILAVTDDGELIRNDRYSHYAGGARHLVFDLMARILIDEDTAADAALVAEIYRFWGVTDKPGLREKTRELAAADHNEAKHFYGRMAPLVTGAADFAPIAAAACDRLVRFTCVGIRLLAGHFTTPTVRVALLGGLARSTAFTGRVSAELAGVAPVGRFHVADPELPPVAGAALLALQRAGVVVDGPVTERLAAGTAQFA